MDSSAGIAEESSTTEKQGFRMVLYGTVRRFFFSKSLKFEFEKHKICDIVLKTKVME